MKIKYVKLKETNFLLIYYIYYNTVYFNVDFDFKLDLIMIIKN